MVAIMGLWWLSWFRGFGGLVALIKKCVVSPLPRKAANFLLHHCSPAGRHPDLLAHMFTTRRVAATAAASAAAGCAWLCMPGQQSGLTPGQPLACALTAKDWVSPDTVRLRFELPSPSSKLGLPVPGHLQVVLGGDGDASGSEGSKDCKDGDSSIFSPISVNTSGFFELLVRKVPKGEFSCHLASLNPGEQATFLGPASSRYSYERGVTPELGLVAAGTGINPMWQVIQQVLNDPNDKTLITLIYASESADTVLLKKELDAASAANPGRMRISYVVGKIDEKLLRDQLPAAPCPETARFFDEVPHLLVSGPHSMLVELCGRRARDGGVVLEDGEENAAGALHPALGGTLRKLGYRPDQVKWL